VGNLSFDVTREELIEAFTPAGRVVDAKVPTDRETGRPRGFAFVEFESEDAARKCIETLNGRELKGRALRINEAENRPPRPPGSAPGGFTPRPPGGGFSRPPGGGFSRPPGGGYRGGPGGGGFPPPFEPEGEGGPGRRFKQKSPSRKPSPKRRRKDDIVDDDDSY
jgi:RNA recognition motif-containing protein